MGDPGVLWLSGVVLGAGVAVPLVQLAAVLAARRARAGVPGAGR